MKVGGRVVRIQWLRPEAGLTLGPFVLGQAFDGTEAPGVVEDEDRAVGEPEAHGGVRRTPAESDG